MIIQHFYRSGRPLRAEIFKVKNFHLHLKPVVPHTFLIGARMISAVDTSTSEILGLKTHLMPELYEFSVNAIS